ncbi:hypothetical protein FDECE_12562 [Fusarium decemcellulare]|nr:hypothetical protein FDECE_12562 [Fusarium decemcellulare]
MRFQSPLVAAATAFLTLFPCVQAQAASSSGSLSLVGGEALFTFDYATQEPDSKNWVGLYHAAGGGPSDGKKGSSNSLRWKWATSSEGRVHIPADSLEPGNYTAFFLAKDGYAWLADPVDVYLPRETTGDVKFLVSDITLPKARVGDAYSYSIAGLIKGGSSVHFSKDSSYDNEWLKVSPDGLLSGTPTSTGRAIVRVRVTGTDSADDGTFYIEVQAKGKPLLDQLTVMSLNMWNGGTGVTNYHDKQVKFLASSGADVIGIQEDQNGRHVPRLAQALGWYQWSSGGDVGILSKYPIAEEYGIVSKPTRAGGVRIALDGDKQQINFYVAHLGYTPYGPYDTCFDHLPVDTVIENEAKSGRTPQIKEIVAAMERHIGQSDETPVFLAGDFNAPSHLDWVDGLKEKNCGYTNFRWPTSVIPTEAGLIDSFRVAHPSPVKEQGITWSPVDIWNTGYKKPEPLDRIDFIYHKGKALKVTDSITKVVGKPKPIPNQRENEWFSDHASVITTYDLDL